MTLRGGVTHAIGRQLLATLVALVASTIVIFGSMYLAPGDTLRFLSGGRTLTPEAEAAFREQFSLDDPLPVRYLNWVTSALQGDFGVSLVSRVPVTEVIAPRIGTSALLLIMASVIMIVLGVSAGLLAGLAGPRTDTAVTAIVNLGMAIPQFVVAALLTAVFAVGLGWFPVFGSGSDGFDRVYHLVLPAIALALASTAYIARIARVAVREQRSSEFVETARSRGLPSSLVIRRHVLRNALIPITTVAGLSIAGLVASSVVVETAFGLNGLGSLLVQSVLAKDFAVVQAVSLILVVLFLAVNLIVDTLYVVLDPRLRTGVPS